jgi:hypothetical protein
MICCRNGKWGLGFSEKVSGCNVPETPEISEIPKLILALGRVSGRLAKGWIGLL